MNPYPPNYRGGYRGSSGSYRGGNQFGSARGGHRAPGFKSGQWNPPTGPAQSPHSTPSSAATHDAAAGPDSRRNEASDANEGNSHPQHSDEMQIDEPAPESQPDPASQQPAPPTGPSNNNSTTPGTARAPPTGPSSSKFSFSFKLASKQTTTHPKPEISQKFNAMPTAKQPPTQPQNHNQQQQQQSQKSNKDRDRDFPKGVPTEPASSRAARRNQEPPQKPIVRTRKVKKIERRLLERPKLDPAFATSKSVFFRKPGNESVVGSGTYGKVFKGLHVYTNTAVALKRIRMEGEQNGFPVTAVREVKLLQSLRHVNIVNLMEVMVEKNDCFMVFEYLAHDLTGLLNHPTFKLDDAQRKHLSKQLFDGLDYLHCRGVLHRDIKAANILVSKEGILKLADFGLARFYAKRHQLDYTNRVVTIWYRSPELLLGETQYGPACDIWSAACVMMEIFVRNAVFPGDGTEANQLERIYAVLGTPSQAEWSDIVEMAWFELLRPQFKVKRTFEEKFRGRLSPAAFELLESMFRYDPAKRPTASEVLAHPYFTTEDPPPRQAIE